MTRPTLIFFGPDGPRDSPQGLKVFLRALLYNTAKRSHVVESMYGKLHRGETVQTFNIRAYGQTGRLERGSGALVKEEGLVCNHHYLLPRDGNAFQFLPGKYIVEVYATLTNQRTLKLFDAPLQLSQEEAAAISQGSGVYFDWGPDSKTYHSHTDLAEQGAAGGAR